MLAVILSGLLMPPPQYDYPPRIPVQVIEERDINRTCRDLGGYRGDGFIAACSMLFPKRCVIFWPRGKAHRGNLWRHERAHCNSWRHS